MLWKTFFFLFWVEGYVRTVILSKIIARQLLIYKVNTSFHANIWGEIP